jgi:ATP-dependent helicase/nuclease subunit A
MTRDAASQRQVEAADPGNSTWLSANAGSGKTRVLTDRVARLLLEGVDPSHILCLTYTKAAATEMQNRLFRRLGAWAMLETDALRSELRALGVEHGLCEDFLREARTLFARAIETPGGLRIQTIHAFCASLLRRFPLEARVSPQFQEMEDRAAERLRAEILDRMAAGPEADLVSAIAPHVSGDDPASLLAEIAGRRERLLPARGAEEIRAAYGIPAGADEDSLIADVFFGDTAGFLAEVAGLCIAEGTGKDVELGHALAAVTPDRAGLDALEAAVLTQAGTLRKKFFNKALAEGAMAPHLARFEALAERVTVARERRLALGAARRDIALHAFAAAFLDHYAAEKQRRGWLDFDDLVFRARDLLSDPLVAAWVLYRLDGGIDHILVDEAQDTAPAQWQVVERLAQEFTAGIGARTDTRRTIFVVGDKKQSIYSFQGADPSGFDRMRAEFGARLEQTDAPLVSTELEYSFRSAEPILRVVDATFARRADSGFYQDQKHRAFKSAMPGRVDLWPLVEPVKEDGDGPWYQPLDRVGARHHTTILARRIARFIRHSIDEGALLPVEAGQPGRYRARPVHAGDFLILVRGRSRLFSEIIRACKQEDLPIAGADRLKVMAELAVRDIVALLRFLATQEDDLSLACALRSPLFGLGEQDLFSLAHGRPGYLWEALRSTRDRFPETVSTLMDLRGQTDFLRPYDLIDRVLTRHRGRQRLLGRLGPEAADGIDALLSQALAYEQTDIPSLTGFLQWAHSDNLEIKRAPDGTGETLRVMTVHGAKGLEAPIVILPDCADPKTAIRDALLTDDHGVLWKETAERQPDRHAAALERAQQADARERDRLLYVAMTRAEKRLIVAAAGSLGSRGLSWYETVRAGMETAGAEPRRYDFGDLGAGEGLQFGTADLTGLPWEEPGAPRDNAVTMPAYLERPAPAVPTQTESRSPSDLGGAKALSGEQGADGDRALARGTATHLLLEWLAPLPAETRIAAAPAFVETLAGMAETASVVDLLPAIREEALAVLAARALAPLFATDTLAEVPVTATLPGLGRIHGVIDRLLVAPERVVAADFKTNRIVPWRPEDTPEGILRQMGAYAAALGRVFPGRAVETRIVWTAQAREMRLPEPLLAAALARAAA